MASNQLPEAAIGTRCIHAGLMHDEFGSASPAIYQTSTFVFENTAQGSARFAGKEPGYIYSRMANPTNKMLEDSVTALEQGYSSMCCATGMGAVNVVFLALLKAGDHVVCGRSVYGCTHAILENLYPKFGVTCSFVDSSSLEAIKAAWTPNTRFLYVESPANPSMDVADIAECAKFAHENKGYLVVDNTFMSPILQNPIKLGADVVIHSVTKFINGHSDLVGGMITAANKEIYDTIKPVYNVVGVTMDPHQAWMTLRGIRTLKLRVLAAQETAKVIAEILEKSPAVEKVFYPGLKSHPQFDTHNKQAAGPGSLISFIMKGGYDAGAALMENLKYFSLAVSLGGVETLIQHPASMTHACVPREERIEAGIMDGLIRLSVGCEDVDDLAKDLKQALAKVEAM